MNPMRGSRVVPPNTADRTGQPRQAAKVIRDAGTGEHHMALDGDFDKSLSRRAMQAELVLAIEKGVIKGVFVPEKWLPATSENFPGRSGEPGRIGFVGREAAAEISKLYLGKRIPDEYKFGTAMPIRYTWS